MISKTKALRINVKTKNNNEEGEVREEGEGCGRWGNITLICK